MGLRLKFFITDVKKREKMLKMSNEVDTWYMVQCIFI